VGKEVAHEKEKRSCRKRQSRLQRLLSKKKTNFPERERKKRFI
jgi:hypothetical protein